MRSQRFICHACTSNTGTVTFVCNYHHKYHTAVADIGNYEQTIWVISW